MSFTPAKVITSSQTGIHKDLLSVLDKHRHCHYQKPVAAHTQGAFEQLYQQWQSAGKPPTVLDSGCGRGDSTRYLAEQFPEHWVIGLDRSAQRLQHSANRHLPGNAHLLRCDCVDFWRLADQASWIFDQHYLLYPNPYPKSEHLKRRWHGHPVFCHLLNISRELEMRTNWKIYAEEFKAALDYVGSGLPLLKPYATSRPITAFERKYLQSGHLLWHVTTAKT